MILVSAHRGGGEIAGRGTLEAYRSALEMGADLVEVDVRRGLDGALVTAHDRAVETSPRLDAVLDLVAAAGAGVHVDVKEAGYEADLVAFVGRYALSPVFYTTGDAACVRALRGAGGRALLTLGPSLAGKPIGARVRAIVRDALPYKEIMDADAQGVAAQFRLAGPLLRRWCARRGFAVLVWTVNDDRRLRHFLRARGVTAVVTDRPRAAIAMRNG